LDERAGAYRAISPALLPRELAGYLALAPGVLRVAVDGAAATGPDALAAEVVASLRGSGRDAVAIRADGFWRDASLRLEYGRTDEYSLQHSWLDHDALCREVLDPLGPGGTGLYLPSLRDPVTNRATRQAPLRAQSGTIAVVSGQFLLGHGLTFDRTIHLSMSVAALGRRTPAESTWTLAALESYETQTAPADIADVVVRLNDPAHPAIRIRTATDRPAIDR
jgi:hypothetical protein